MYKRAVVLFVLAMVAVLSGVTLLVPVGACLFAVGALDVVRAQAQLHQLRLDSAWELTADLLGGHYFAVDEGPSSQSGSRQIAATVDGVRIDILHQLPGEEPYTLVSARVAAPPGWRTFLPQEDIYMPSTYPLPASFELRCSEDGIYAVSDVTIDESECLLRASHAVAGLSSEAQRYHPWNRLAHRVDGQLNRDPVSDRWTLCLPNGREDMLVEVTPQGDGYRTVARQSVRGSAPAAFELHRRDTLSLPPAEGDRLIGDYVLTGSGAQTVLPLLNSLAPLLRAARPLSLTASHDHIVMNWSGILDKPLALRSARKIMRKVARARQHSPYR